MALGLPPPRVSPPLAQQHLPPCHVSPRVKTFRARTLQPRVAALTLRQQAAPVFRPAACWPALPRRARYLAAAPPQRCATPALSLPLLSEPPSRPSRPAATVRKHSWEPPSPRPALAD